MLMISTLLNQGLHSLAILLLFRPVSSVILGDVEAVVLEFYGLYWVLETDDRRTGFFASEDDAVRYLQSQMTVAEEEGRGMNKAGELIITESFNGLLSRMAGLDHLGILMEGRKIPKNAKRQKIEPTMKISEVIQLTGMTKDDLDFFISLRLIEVVQPSDDPVISLRHVHCLVRNFYGLC